MAYKYGNVFPSPVQVPPIVTELEAIFKEVPDEELLTKLQDIRRRGPKGYEPTILWHCYVAYYYMGPPSVYDLIRTLYDNPFIAEACGIHSPDEIPSQPTFSRFFSKLASVHYRTIVRNVSRSLTKRLYDTLPDFGKSVAIDSTDIKAWSNGGKKGKKGKVSDPDAGWIVKKNTEGNRKFVWGYKVHILADTQYELPIAVDISKGNLHDVNKAAPLLRQARYDNHNFYPDYVICDAGYSSDQLRRSIRRLCRAEPIIDPNPSHKKAFAKTIKTPEWKMIYGRRASIERLNGRLKAHRKLNSVRVRGRFKVRIHVMFSIIVCQAQALASSSLNSVRKVA